MHNSLKRRLRDQRWPKYSIAFELVSTGLLSSFRATDTFKCVAQSCPAQEQIDTDKTGCSYEVNGDVQKRKRHVSSVPLDCSSREPQTRQVRE